MKRARTLFLCTSVTVVLLFAGVLMANRNSQDGLFRALGNLAEVVHLIETEYVDELNQEALALSLDAGLVESLDPSAAVLPSDRVDDYLEFVESAPPYGLGLASRLGSAAVHFVFSGSPAQDAGLEEWELIELVEGVNSRGRPLWQIRLEIMEREKMGEPVHLTVFDRQVNERREVVLEAKPWTVQPASAELHEEATVVKIESMPLGAAEKITALIPEGGAVILDLRGLRWGLASEVMAFADGFASEGVLGAWKGRRAGSKSYAATEGVVSDSMPVVLVGRGTEDAGEILAVALARQGAVVVGEKTLGHAPYMNLVRDGEVALWMPVGEWLRGDDEPIEGNGVEPTEEVEAGDPDGAVDPVLDHALQLLRPELKKAA